MALRREGTLTYIQESRLRAGLALVRIPLMINSDK